MVSNDFGKKLMNVLPLQVYGFTDPPYNVRTAGNVCRLGRKPPKAVWSKNGDGRIARAQSARESTDWKSHGELERVESTVGEACEIFFRGSAIQELNKWREKIQKALIAFLPPAAVRDVIGTEPGCRDSPRYRNVCR